MGREASATTVGVVLGVFLCALDVVVAGALATAGMLKFYSGRPLSNRPAIIHWHWPSLNMPETEVFQLNLLRGFGVCRGKGPRPV